MQAVVGETVKPAELTISQMCDILVRFRLAGSPWPALAAQFARKSKLSALPGSRRGGVA
jgi:hypothetical protein